MSQDFDSVFWFVYEIHVIFLAKHDIVEDLIYVLFLIIYYNDETLWSYIRSLYWLWVSNGSIVMWWCITKTFKIFLSFVEGKMLLMWRLSI